MSEATRFADTRLGTRSGRLAPWVRMFARSCRTLGVAVD